MTSDENLRKIELECGELDPKPDVVKSTHKTEKLRQLQIGLSSLIFLIMLILALVDVISEDTLFYIFMFYVIMRLNYIAKTQSLFTILIAVVFKRYGFFTKDKNEPKQDEETKK